MATITLQGETGHKDRIIVQWSDHNNVKHETYVEIGIRPDDKPRTFELELIDAKHLSRPAILTLPQPDHYVLTFPQGRAQLDTVDTLLQEAGDILEVINSARDIPDHVRTILKTKIQRMAWQMGLETRPATTAKP